MREIIARRLSDETGPHHAQPGESQSNQQRRPD
jgi:hypothetical protein